MPVTDPPPDHLSDYERAICYFALPRVVTPVNPGLIAAYAVCLFEAVGALGIGLAFNHRAWMLAGAGALWGIILLGVIIFTGRALLNDFRERRLLAQARGVPNAQREAQDLPDPFEGHLLLQHPANARGRLFSCHDAEAEIKYFVDSDSRGRWWKIRTPQDEEVGVVTARWHWYSWTLGAAQPCVLSVKAAGAVLARVCPVFSFAGATLRVQTLMPTPRVHMIRQLGIYHETRLVGRIYALRDSFYLDIEEDQFDVGLLAYFVSLT